MQLGVDIGPDPTDAGSPVTLLWRRVLRAADAPPSVGEFSAVGLLTGPVPLTAAVLALWMVGRALSRPRPGSGWCR